jgi:predicted ArsR family transcriptional regulator
MLRQLLAAIAGQPGVCTNDELARRLGVSRETVERLMNELLRMGCLRLGEVEDCEDAACTACPHASTCEPMLGAHLWELTEKGRRWLGEVPGHSSSRRL